MTECKTVVLIDDDEDLREAMSDLLTAHGFAVVAASGGREGLALLRATHLPCFVLLDLMMPDISGWDVIAEMAKEPGLASLPVYICTSAPENAPAGFPLVRKPVDTRALIDEVHRHCDPGR